MVPYVPSHVYEGLPMSLAKIEEVQDVLADFEGRIHSVVERRNLSVARHKRVL